MEYTIRQASKITELPSSTLRYYESEGLLPDIKRNRNGHRYYDESNLKWIALITCLKNTNMPIELIKIFVTLHNEGDKTLNERLEIVLQHRENVQKKIDELNNYMKYINYKVDYYTLACELGTENKLKNNKYPQPLYVEDEEELPMK
jgi:DNA-binding transcriptional MerR regulator